MPAFVVQGGNKEYELVALNRMVLQNNVLRKVVD